MLTREQIELLATAIEGHVLITPIGSANDILWGQFCDKGFMEPADLPSDLASIPGLGWNAWKMTAEGKTAFSANKG